jgi:coenzyme F420-reducing hydrogenase gamma subunit
VWKFASCDGCQLTLLDCEDELLTLAEQVQIAAFAEASSAVMGGPYDVSLVEGSITTAADKRRIREIREQSGVLMTIGACATAGGIQALRNWGDHDAFRAGVYAHPEFIHSLARSTPIAEHVQVDAELRGCPIDRRQLVATIAALLNRHVKRLPTTSVQPAERPAFFVPKLRQARAGTRIALLEVQGRPAADAASRPVPPESADPEVSRGAVPPVPRQRLKGWTRSRAGT